MVPPTSALLSWELRGSDALPGSLLLIPAGPPAGLWYHMVDLGLWQETESGWRQHLGGFATENLLPYSMLGLDVRFTAFL